ncbi:MAG: hypothetical protein RMJ52_11725 [Gemmataceae bacterium]|nr:hypothetical protein [Gemmataceae bacterium]
MPEPYRYVPPVHDDLVPLGEDVLEMTLLLPQWQVQALLQAAQHREITVAQMLRQLIRDFFHRETKREDDARVDVATQW